MTLFIILVAVVVVFLLYLGFKIAEKDMEGY